MTNEKVKEVCDLYYAKLADFGPAEQLSSLEDNSVGHNDVRVASLRHVRWMAEETSKFVDTGRVEKAMRWLGFMQGWLTLMGIYTIYETMKHNMPPETTADLGA